jgi:5-methylthioadenosine/S-adenosylhomocysteine deaminase
MRTVDRILEAAWVVPVEPHGTVLAEHAVVIDGGCIVAVLPQAEAGRQFQARARERFDQHVLMPTICR